MDNDCTHPKHYGSGDMRTCANPLCAVWLVPDAEPVTVADAPPAVAVEQTVTIAGTGRGTTKKRGKR